MRVSLIRLLSQVTSTDNYASWCIAYEMLSTLLAAPPDQRYEVKISPAGEYSFIAVCSSSLGTPSSHHKNRRAFQEKLAKTDFRKGKLRVYDKLTY